MSVNLKLTLDLVNENIKNRYLYSPKNIKGYKRGYSHGIERGCSWSYLNTYLLPQEKNHRRILSLVEYDRGFYKGIWDGLKCKRPYSYTFVYDDFISSIASSDKLCWQRVINNTQGIIESYIDAAFENALKKSACVDIDNTRIHDILRSFTETTGSFLYYLRKELTGYFLKLVLLEAMIIYDGISFESVSSETVTKLFKSYGLRSLSLSDLNDADWSAKIIERYIQLLSSEECEKNIISKSRTSIWRLKTELNRQIGTISKQSLSEYFERCLKTKSDYLLYSNLSQITRNFALSDYLASDLIFMTLFNDIDNIKTVLPMSFAPYIGFIIHNLSEKRNIFHHCEEYFRKQSKNVTHNQTRDFTNVKDAYIRYSETVDLLLESLECESGIMHAQYICNEFLLNTHILHRQFFSTTNSDLFDYLSKTALTSDEVAYKSNSSALPHNCSISYELLKYLHYFDIDLSDLSANFECREEYYVDPGLSEITEFIEITDELKMPLKFILAILKEVYKDRGDTLYNALKEFRDNYDHTDAFTNSRLNKLSSFVNNFSQEYYYKDKSIHDLPSFDNKRHYHILADMIYSTVSYGVI